MADGEKRKFIRCDSLHLLDYLVIEPDGVEGRYSMGRTLDVSLNGLKMETTYELPRDAELQITVGLEDDLIDLVGRVVYTTHKSGRHISGIEFIRMSPEGRRVFQLYTDAFKQFRTETTEDAP